MTDVKICDRCGRKQSSRTAYLWGTVTTSWENGRRGKTLDLCGACAAGIKDELAPSRRIARSNVVRLRSVGSGD